VYDKPPFAIASIAKTGITKPKDLEGRVLGAPPPDGAFAQWKAFVHENKIDASKVKIESIGFPVREPMLADGKVDAIAGFSFSMHYNLLARNLKPDDIRMMLMADHGLVLYGNAIMVNPDYAKANPKVVAGFVKATIKGVLDTIKDPDAAIKTVMKRNDTGDEKIELDRLQMSLRDNFVTPWVKTNGFGGIDQARLAKSIDQIALTYDFKNRPRPEDIFTSQYRFFDAREAQCVASLIRDRLSTRWDRSRAVHASACLACCGRGPLATRIHDHIGRYRQRHADLSRRVGRGAGAAGHEPDRAARRICRRGRAVRMREVVADEARHRARAAR
jgi:ABC-type nitrate/sulfonate/bicarbonate transport system substrate-binding protein